MTDRDSKVEYEATWAGLRAVIDEHIAAGETNAAEIARAATDHESLYSMQPAFQYYLGGAQTPPMQLVVENGAYVAKPITTHDPPFVHILRQVLAENPDRFQHVVELGSGFGRNLLFLREALMEIGITVPELHACEYTQTGRAATKALADAEKILIHVHAFDYRRADLSFLPEGASVLFFTSHSLEQVTVAPASFVEEMLRRTVDCVCFHFEPVGWQFEKRLLEWRSSRDTVAGVAAAVLAKIRWKLLRASSILFRLPVARGFQGIPKSDVVLGAKDKVSLNGARWSARLSYNKNLVPLLRQLEASGRIRISRTDVETYGVTPFNPTTMIGWERV